MTTNESVHAEPDSGEDDDVRSPALRGKMQGPVEVMFRVSEVKVRSLHAP